MTRKDLLNKFPSPYGVIFILTLNLKKLIHWVSQLGFRLLMELYSFLHTYMGQPNVSYVSILVSVSLWSYIHSYMTL